MPREPYIPNEIDSPPSTALKMVAALFVCGFLCVIFLPAILSVADIAYAPDPADGFSQLTGWKLPAGARILNIRDTHGGITNDGDYTLTIQLTPQQLHALVAKDQNRSRECPIDVEITRSAWDLPDHSGTQYYAKKTFDSDSNWHRGHVVIVNPDTGMIWIYEWKG